MINADVFTPTKIQNGTGIYDARIFPKELRFAIDLSATLQLKFLMERLWAFHLKPSIVYNSYKPRFK